MIARNNYARSILLFNEISKKIILGCLPRQVRIEYRSSMQDKQKSLILLGLVPFNLRSVANTFESIG
jgi:hypothetical protein